jgi:hypothetical protein
LSAEGTFSLTEENTMHTTKFAPKTFFGQLAKAALPMTLGALLAQPVLAADEAEPDATEMVNALNRVFGAKPGVRASHAKGFCAKGEFTPDAQAGRFVKGPMFATNHPGTGLDSFFNWRRQSGNIRQEPQRSWPRGSSHPPEGSLRSGVDLGTRILCRHTKIVCQFS